LTRRLLLLGGGHAQCAVLADFAQRPLPGVELLLVSPNRHAVYSGMVPGWIAGDYTFDQCRIDLALLAERAGARLVQARAVSLDADAHRVELDSGECLDYDLLSLDVGSAAAVAGIEGAAHAVTLRPIEELEPALLRLEAQARQGGLRRMVVVGGGAAGVESVLALNHRLSTLSARRMEVCLLADTPCLLSGHAQRARALVRDELDRQGIVVRLAAMVQAVESQGVRLASGEQVAADAVILATGAAPHDWLAASRLALDERGFVAVDDSLRSVSHPEVFGAGDAVTTIAHPRPKAGVFAVRHGPVLARNLRQALSGGDPRPHISPERALAIFNTGGRRAIAAWGGLAAGGAWVWHWKDWLDRRFMRRYA
jgi:selenide,water dikinase